MQGPESMVGRLVAAANRHDLEALVACFAPDGYVNETPAHPARSFRGREQVRRNWEQIFAHVPDIISEVLRASYGPDIAWTEWEMRGTRRDGSEALMRGVMIFGVTDGLARWCRFYLEPVDAGSTTVDDAVRAQVVRQ